MSERVVARDCDGREIRVGDRVKHRTGGDVHTVEAIAMMDAYVRLSGNHFASAYNLRLLPPTPEPEQSVLPSILDANGREIRVGDVLRWSGLPGFWGADKRWTVLALHEAVGGERLTGAIRTENGFFARPRECVAVLDPIKDVPDGCNYHCPSGACVDGRLLSYSRGRPDIGSCPRCDTHRDARRAFEDVPDPAGSVGDREGNAAEVLSNQGNADNNPTQPAAVGAVCAECKVALQRACSTGALSHTFVSQSGQAKLVCLYCFRRLDRNENGLTISASEIGTGIALAPVEDEEPEDAQWESATWGS